MSSTIHVQGPRFIRPNEVIERLKYARTQAGYNDTHFDMMGAGDFEKAVASATFVQAAPAVLYVMVGNSSASLISDAGLTRSEVSHAIDIVLYLRSTDNRLQYSDQISVFFKEFIAWSLQGYTPFDGAEPLTTNGDSLQQIRNVADYTRVYQYGQSVTVDGTDTLGDGDPDDVPEFLQVFDDMTAIAPDFEEVTPLVETNIELRD